MAFSCIIISFYILYIYILIILWFIQVACIQSDMSSQHDKMSKKGRVHTPAVKKAGLKT